MITVHSMQYMKSGPVPRDHSYHTILFFCSLRTSRTLWLHLLRPNNCVCSGRWNNLNIRRCAKQNLINTPPNPTTMVSKLILCYATHCYTHPWALCQFSLPRTSGRCERARQQLQTAAWKTDSVSIHTVEQLHSLFTVSSGRAGLDHTSQLTFTGVSVCHRKTQKPTIFSCCLYDGYRH